MRRRAFLSVAAGLLPVGSGCVSPGDGAPPTESPPTSAASPSPPTTADDTPPPSDTPTPNRSPSPSPSLADHAFAFRTECEDPGGATVEFDSSAVGVSGCIRGPNGCSVPALGDVRYDGESDVFTVVVTTERRGDDDTACTQAIVDRGYRVDARFENGLPGTVVVVHEGAYGRVEAARVTRN